MILLALLLSPSLVIAQAKDQVSISGKWKIHTEIAGNEQDQDCTFAQVGTDLTGSCTSESGEVKIAGKVDGTNVTWSYTSKYNDSPLTVKYTGVLDGGTKISGTVNVEEFGAGGDFLARLVK
jgi:hypothetical protein